MRKIFSQFDDKIWLNAYAVLCLWYFINFIISTTAEYIIMRPFLYTIINGFVLFVAICAMVVVAWRWAAFLFKYNIALQSAGHVVGVILWFFYIGTIHYFVDYYMDDFTMIDEWQEFLLLQLSTNVFQYNLQYLTAIFIYYIIRYIQQIQEKEFEKAQLAIENNEMEMALLKSQINPHFLFNTLNSISTLVGSNKLKAREMLSKLSSVFRYALVSHDDSEVPLAQELEFIRNFMNIQQVRFGDRLEYKEIIEDDCMDIKIPPMVLQPIVENSVKHGISPKDEGGLITLSIKRKGNYVNFSVSDDGVGMKVSSENSSGGSGVGLINTDKRLQNMYGKESKIKIEPKEEGFLVEFKIPLEHA